MCIRAIAIRADRPTNKLAGYATEPDNDPTMRLSRFFIDTPLASGELALPDAQAHYIARVLRLSPGDRLQLFDGSGREALATLVEVGKRQVRVSIETLFDGQPESPLAIHLGQGLSRGERMDWAIQKATELGAKEITPLLTERCEVRLSDERADKRVAHWRQIAISAAEQCGRSVLPVIHAPQPLAGPAEAHGDLVVDQMHLVAIAGFAQELQVDRVVHAHATGALDQRLDDHRGDLVVVLGEGLLHGRKHGA